MTGSTPLGTITRAEAISAAARVWAEARARRDALPVREAALAAHVPGGPSVEELTTLIQSQRDHARAKADPLRHIGIALDPRQDEVIKLAS